MNATGRKAIGLLALGIGLFILPIRDLPKLW
jgi:hypothetical protein